MKKGYIIYVGSLVLLTGALLLISWRRKAGIFASSFLGIQEIGDNAGFANAAFEQMMKDVGWLGGEAWCMFFAKAVYLDSFPKKADQIKKVLTGSTQGSWAAAQQHPELFTVIQDGRPKPGDIIIWKSTKDPSKGHAGIVLKKDSGDYYNTVEGNSGLGGTREGQGVTKGHRLLVPGTVEGSLKLLGFIRMKSLFF